MSVNKPIESKIDEARSVIIKSLPLDKYLVDNKYLYSATPSGSIKCPVHDENTPSCSFDAEKGVYHCFGCGSKGSVVEMATAISKKSDDKANTVKTILSLAKQYDIKIPNMFEYEVMNKPRRKKNQKYDYKKNNTKSEDIIYNRQIERLELDLVLLDIPDRLRAYRVIDKVFLNEMKPKAAHEKLTTFINAKVGK